VSNEPAYHKLKDINDAAKVIANPFNPSLPPEKHWLGEGVYFF